MNDELPDSPTGEFLLYSTEDGKARVECRFENETIWLSQALIGELYDRSKKTISEHLKNLFEEGELMPDSVVRNFRTTAAELIAERADATQPNMGLTVWKGEIVRKTDVTVAKNYLHEDEIDELNRIVVMWLDFAFDQAKRRKQIFLQDWQTKLDDFLEFNARRVLTDAGKKTKKAADEAAKKQYDQFAERRRLKLEEQGAAQSIKALESLSEKTNKNES